MSSNPPEPFDPLVDMVQDECPSCGAYMLNESLHGVWHKQLSARLNDLGKRADSYKDPPRYA